MKKSKFLALITLLISLLCCGILFGCDAQEPDVPKVENVVLAAADTASTGKAGVLHQLSYTVPKGSKVSTSVDFNGKTATPAEYLCNEEGYIFYSAGEYTVTVYAAKDGMVGSDSVKLTVQKGAAHITDVELVAAAGEVYGKVGMVHVLRYTASEGSEIAVEVKKGDGAASSADYTFDALHSTLVFHTPTTGTEMYTVNVTATLGSTFESVGTQLSITVDPPTVTLEAENTLVEAGRSVVLTRTVKFAREDGFDHDSFTVRRGGSQAASSEYSLKGDVFTPFVAGSYVISYRVDTLLGGYSSASATVNCTAAQIGLSLATEGAQRVQLQTATDIPYIVSGNVDGFEVSFTSNHPDPALQLTAGNGTSVRILDNRTETDWFTVTVTYTSKGGGNAKSIEIPVYTVDDLYLSPTWGEDPFGGMPDEVLTNMGHLIYFDASPFEGAKYEFTRRDLSLEVAENNVTAPSGGEKVEVLLAGGENADYPYVIQSSFDKKDAGDGTGNFVLRMRLTDPYLKMSIVAEKKFTVTPTQNSNDDSPAVIQSYIERHNDFFTESAFDFNDEGTKLGHDARLNMILTKDGYIIGRPSAGMSFDAGGALGVVRPASGENVRLAFTVTPVTFNGGGKMELGIGIRAGSFDTWVDYLDLEVNSGVLGVTAGKNFGEIETTATVPVSIGKPFHIQIDRTKSEDKVVFTVFCQTEENGEFVTLLKTAEITSSTKEGKAFGSVVAYQFDRRSGMGCGTYAVENVAVFSIQP